MEFAIWIYFFGNYPYVMEVKLPWKIIPAKYGYIVTPGLTITINTLGSKNKSDGKRRNTLGCLDQYACNVLRLWNSGDCETV